MDCISKSGQISLCYEHSPVDFFSIYLSFSLHLPLFASLVFRFKRKFYPFIWIFTKNEKITFAHKTNNKDSHVHNKKKKTKKKRTENTKYTAQLKRLRFFYVYLWAISKWINWWFSLSWRIEEKRTFQAERKGNFPFESYNS